MYLSKIRVRNYKSFRDSGDIEFKPGINIIVGQNNSGKTTLLEALEIKASNIPHRSLNTNRNKESSKESSNKSVIYGSLHLSRQEIPSVEKFKKERDWFYRSTNFFNVPFPEKYKYFLDRNETSVKIEDSKESIEKRIEEFNKRKEISEEKLRHFVKLFNNSLERGITFNFQYSDNILNENSLNYGLLNEKLDDQMEEISLRWNESELNFERSYEQPNNREDNLNYFGWEKVVEFSEKIYRFSAERPNLGSCLVGFSTELKSDASNLAEVLQNIKNDNPDIYDEFNKYISEVSPSVKWVSSNKIEAPQGSIGGNWNEVRIWSVDKKTRRTDLAFPLSACGTGIGQVLAILYVVISSEEPRTIIIDEPNSFLHPSASKKLIQILNQKEFSHHQYFISTHSPEILAKANPSTVTLLKYENGETRVEQLDLSQGNDKLKLVSELGMEISDFFFAENVLWVEGPTETKAFPMILARSKSLFNFIAVPLVHTDDLKDRKRGRKHAKTNIENIRRLSGEYALTPPKIFTILDREDTSNQEIQDLEKLGINFIPRRLFENYLLDAEAITEILNSEIIEETEKTTVEQVENILATSQKEFSDETVWLQKVHGAKLLEKIFSEISKATVEYRKTTHSVELTKWLLENKPEQLKELQDFLISIIEIG